MIKTSFFELPKIQRDYFRTILEQNAQLLQEINSIKKDTAELVRKEIDKVFSERVEMIDASLRESILHKRILIEKGLITRQELEDKYKELKERPNG